MQNTAEGKTKFECQKCKKLFRKHRSLKQHITVMHGGDDNVLPILGYSENGSFDLNNIPINFDNWLKGYEDQIQFVLENNLLADNDIIDKWNALDSGNWISPPALPMAVNPLITSSWDQSPYYNALCPGGSVTGCVATAMAQIMRYWQHPSSGTGSHTYYHSTYGNISANFGGRKTNVFKRKEESKK